MSEDRAPVPAAGSTLLREPLQAPPQAGAVLGVVGRTCYLAFGDRVVALEGRNGPGLPFALVLAAPALDAAASSARSGAPARIGAGRLALGDLELVPARWWEPRPRLAALAPGVLDENVGLLRVALASRPAPEDPAARPLAVAAAALRDAVGEVDAARTRRAAAGLVGLGGGLTPAGDDFLTGLVASLRLLAPLRQPVSAPLAALAEALTGSVLAAAAERTTALSAALLRASAGGAVPRGVAALLHAITGRGDVTTRARELLGLGHSSGWWLAEGVALGAAVVVSGVPGQPRGALVGKER